MVNDLLKLRLTTIASSIYWTGPMQSVKSPMKLVLLGGGGGAVVCFLKRTVNTLKNYNVNKVIVLTSGE